MRNKIPMNKILIQELENPELKKYMGLSYEAATMFVTNDIARMLWEEEAIGYHSSYKYRGGQLRYQDLIDQMGEIYTRPRRYPYGGRR